MVADLTFSLTRQTLARSYTKTKLRFCLSLVHLHCCF
nr:MAG TPA: hypothetical protein [Caudoviricetes sp.]